MQQISPEGAASILGRYKSDAHKAEQFPKDCQALATAQKIYAGVCSFVILLLYFFTQYYQYQRLRGVPFFFFKRFRNVFETFFTISTWYDVILISVPWAVRRTVFVEVPPL